MKTLILYNPLSGNGGGEARANELKATYAEQGEVSVIDITSVSDCADLLGELCEDDVAIVCGGDGTLCRLANCVDASSIRCELLYSAVGTGNDFLRDLDKTVDDAPFSIKKYLGDLPVVTVNGKSYRFLNGIGFGIDGYCCEVGDKKKAKGEKNINYTAIAIKGLLLDFKPKNATVRIDGKEYNYKKVWIAPTMKGRFYGGGMMPTPAQDRLAPDGKLSLMLFHGSGKLKTLMIFPSLFKGEHLKYNNNIAIHEGYNVEVSFDSPSALQIDGETVLGVTSYKVFAKVPANIK